MARPPGDGDGVNASPPSWRVDRAEDAQAAGRMCECRCIWFCELSGTYLFRGQCSELQLVVATAAAVRMGGVVAEGCCGVVPAVVTLSFILPACVPCRIVWCLFPQEICCNL